MKEIVLITGGCRSGKSSYALEYAQRLSDQGRYFLATCQPSDEEMVDRVARHQQERHESWQTKECPVDLSEAVKDLAGDARVILIDCLTLWITNLLVATDRQDVVESYIEVLQKTVTAATCSVVLVTNEVGCGIVPDNRLARLFRDFVGIANQQMAMVATRVIWMVSGCPVIVKEDSQGGPVAG
jgi:adenosylcobinamide kinase / adenosylcobinamide-phosphate guanylyltransferase